MSKAFSTAADVREARRQIESGLDGYEAPAAFGVGVATISAAGDVLDVAYPHVHAGTGSLAAAALSQATGHHAGTQTVAMTDGQLRDAIDLLAPAESLDGPHPHLAAWRACLDVANTPSHGGTRQLVGAFIGSLDDPPADAVDGYLRLHLLSHRVIRPHQMSMDGIFGVLSNVVWTNLGPFAVADFELTRMRLRSQGHTVVVFGVDKFPRMVDYVVPAGVRIADGARVRLGAHLAAGTTVMHEGFCNFNAGTLGASMVEGRISAGVLVGDGTDIGGGASIMGTLSGGGQQTISLGSDCLLGANSGLGISLGDDCIVEAGLYLTAGTLVAMPDGTTVKAHDISGADGLLFRRNSVTGAVEALARSGASWHGLNTALHDND